MSASSCSSLLTLTWETRPSLIHLCARQTLLALVTSSLRYVSVCEIGLNWLFYVRALMRSGRYDLMRCSLVLMTNENQLKDIKFGGVEGWWGLFNKEWVGFREKHMYTQCCPAEPSKTLKFPTALYDETLFILSSLHEPLRTCFIYTLGHSFSIIHQSISYCHSFW